ncbi:MAG: response regulator, partial [Solirubrobacteraceae bacterium]|nr:response regulator [Solirubrobacteraceae bacterium]
MKQKTKILVVDDDPNLRKTLSDILRIKGYEIAIAANGAEAIAAAERETFSLALIDLMLPDMPGLEVMVRIKAISPLTEAIILTGNASMDTAIEATKQGAYSYLLKPYQMDDLLQNIQHGVERQQAQEEILRLASFPRLTPIPVIEVNSSGEVTYANPAAEKLFPNQSSPDLDSKAWSHPLLNGLSGFDELRQSKQRKDVAREVEIGQATYELHTHYILELDLIRIYVLDITKRKMAEKEIHLLATTDSLTGIANRREFSAILARELDRAKRYGAPLSLAMYDLDYFKRVNDTFGH